MTCDDFVAWSWRTGRGHLGTAHALSRCIVRGVDGGEWQTAKILDEIADAVREEVQGS